MAQPVLDIGSTIFAVQPPAAAISSEPPGAHATRAQWRLPPFAAIGFAAAGLLTGLAVGNVAASNFGSNVNSADEVAHTCDATLASQCVANNSSHLVYKVALTANISAAVDDAIAKANAIRDFAAQVWGVNDVQDVNAHDGDYGNTEWWAYTACTPSATHGGVAPNRLWCKPQDNVFNWNHPQQWDATLSGPTDSIEHFRLVNSGQALFRDFGGLVRGPVAPEGAFVDALEGLVFETLIANVVEARP